MGLLFVVLGGGLGAGLRYLISLLVNKYIGIPFYGTFFINIVGSLFLGFILPYAVIKGDLFSANLRLFLTVGIAGGFTTFSTFSYEALALIRSGQILTALFYMFVSPILGVLAAYFGFIMVK